ILLSLLLASSAKAGQCPKKSTWNSTSYDYSDSDCNAYLELENATHCGDSGYALNFGYPICRNFVDNRCMFFPNGKAFIDCAKPCLANYVRDHIIAAGITNCSEITQLAFASHIPCYNECHFCDVILSNSFQFGFTFGERFQAFFSDPAFQQLIAIGSDCASNPLGFLLSVLGILPRT
ncbi:hypothetical protein PMAYCL1PPCAC_19691, partial [Pristionchus mayeri]